jgi:AraC-like DNA-binding protein
METGQWINIIGFIHIIAGIQGLFLVILLNGYPAENRIPNRALSLLIFSFSVIILGAGLGATGLYLSQPHLIRIGAPFVLILGPAMLFYITAIRTGNIPSVQWLHFIPFLLYVIFLLPFYLSPANIKIEWVEVTMASSGFDSLLNLLKVIHVFGYIAWIFRLLTIHPAEVKGLAPDFKATDLEWLRKLTGMLLIVVALSIVVFGLSAAGMFDTILANFILGFVIAVLIYILGYRALTQPQIFGDRDYAAWQYDSAWKLFWGNLHFNRKENTGQDHQQREQDLLQKLKHYMESEKPYRDSELSLSALSSATNIPQYLISRIINEHLDKNFFDFVNEYRVREVCDHLTDPAWNNFTILAIAMDAGFNSKSSFNTAFRKSTGRTPSEYKNQFIKN